MFKIVGFDGLPHVAHVSEIAAVARENVRSSHGPAHLAQPSRCCMTCWACATCAIGEAFLMSPRRPVYVPRVQLKVVRELAELPVLL